MKNLILSALAVTALAVPAVSVASVDPDFGVEEPRPINVLRRNGVNPIARILLFPLMPFVEAQAKLQPEKASCWNDRASEVAGCSVVEQIETAKGRREERREERPTPYRF
tara:strand:+ start:129 stop:458 length:330 start_codon:yes stop_codon:yes gene_type:complete